MIRKRLLSACLALALCLSLLPATALAAGEIKLFIGGQQITESSCYENQNGIWTKVDGTEPANGQFYYDAATFTLTLNQAKITNNETVNVAEGYTYYGSVIAFSQTADVSLKIVVSQGTSNITGTGGIRVVSEAGDASLSISGPGSLEVNVDKNDSGISLIGSKNVNLNIDGADVKTLAATYYGVDLHAGDGFQAAAVVNNGKLTAGSSSGIGIYYRWTNPSDSCTSSLTVSGNAVVDTRDSKILISSEASKVQVGAGSDGNGGIVFDGENGTVYGDVTLDESLTIGSEETLTIPDDSSLNSNGKLTNNGKIIVDNGGKLEGIINGNQPPKITTTSLPNGEVDTTYNQTLGATGSETITWSLASGSTMPAGLTLNSDGTITGTPTTAGQFTFTATATNSAGSDSKEYELTINAPQNIPVNGVTLNPTLLSLFTGGSETLTATVEPSNATNKNVTWSSDKPEVATVENGKVTAKAAGTATITVTTEDGEKTATCTVTVSRYSTGGGPTTYAITAPDAENGTVRVSPSRASRGTTVTITVTPDEGYELESLTVLDSRDNEITLTDKGDGKYTFTMPSGRVTVEASFAEIAPEPLPFGDVDDGDWFADAVRFVYENGMMNGVSETDFAPHATTSRSMIVTILYRLEGEPVVDYAMGFTDVAGDAYYAEAVRWAASEGIVGGYGGGLFGSDDAVTREQLAVILYRYAVYKGYDVSIGEDTNILSYADFADLSEYAIPAMQWACGAGIVNGTSESTLAPQGEATRAQVAAMLMRFVEAIG